MLVGACGEGGDDSAGDDASSDCTRFVLLDEADGWEFREAVDYPEDLGDFGSSVGPTLDWYAEYERLDPAADGQSVEGVSLVLSGHDVGLAEFRSRHLGGELEERQGAEGAMLVRPGGEGEPSELAQSSREGYTIQAVSYGLDLEELIQVVSATRPACQQQWLDAGGKILDCVPTEPDCGAP